MKLTAKKRWIEATEQRPSLPRHTIALDKLTCDGEPVAMCRRGEHRLRTIDFVNGREIEQCVRCGWLPILEADAS